MVCDQPDMMFLAADPGAGREDSSAWAGRQSNADIRSNQRANCASVTTLTGSEAILVLVSFIPSLLPGIAAYRRPWRATPMKSIAPPKSAEFCVSLKKVPRKVFKARHRSRLWSWAVVGAKLQFEVLPRQSGLNWNIACLLASRLSILCIQVHVPFGNALWVNGEPASRVEKFTNANKQA